MLAVARCERSIVSRLPLELLFCVFELTWQRAPIDGLRVTDGERRYSDAHNLACLGDYLLIPSGDKRGLSVYRKGKFLRHVGAGDLILGHCVTVAGDRIWAPSNERGDVYVYRFTDDGFYLERRIPLDWGDYHGVAAADGLIYLSRRATGTIEVISEDGTHIRSITRTEDGATIAMHPRGLAVDNGMVFVADFYRREIHVLRADSGEFVRSLGKGHLEDEKLTSPMDVCVRDGLAFVSDKSAHCVRVLCVYDGRPVACLGGPTVTDYPAGLCISADDVLYVVCRRSVVSFDLSAPRLPAEDCPATCSDAAALT